MNQNEIENQNLYNQKIIWIDTETTGLNAKENGILQIAYIVIKNNKILGKGNIEMQPMKNEKISEKALEINGIKLEKIKNRTKNNLAIKIFKKNMDDFINKYNPKDKMIIAGYNVGFDIEFLENWFLKNNDEYFYSYFKHETIDLYKIIRYLWAIDKIKTKNCKLKTICEYWKIPLDPHDAMDDINATYLLNKKIKEVIKIEK